MRTTQTKNTTSATRTTAPNHSGVQKRGTSAFGRVLSKICNTFQKLAGTYGQKTHSLQPTSKMKIVAINTEVMDNIANEKLEKANNTNQLNQLQIQRPKDPPPLPPTPNASRATSVSSLTVAQKTQVTRPTSPPPPPPTQNSSSAVSSSGVASKPPRPEPPAPFMSRNSNSATSASSSAVENKPLVPVRSAPPIPAPIAANASQQGPEISTQKESEPVKRKAPTIAELYALLNRVEPKKLASLKEGLAVELNQRKNNQ